MTVVIALRRLQLNMTADLDDVSEAVSAAAVGWAQKVDAHLQNVGLPGTKTVECRVVPTPELVALLASGAAFRVESGFLIPVPGAKT